MCTDTHPHTLSFSHIPFLLISYHNDNLKLIFKRNFYKLQCPEIYVFLSLSQRWVFLMFRGFIFSCMDSFEGLYSICIAFVCIVQKSSRCCVRQLCRKCVCIYQSINLLYGRWSKEEKDRREKKQKHIRQKFKMIVFCIDITANVNEKCHESVLCLIKSNYPHCSMALKGCQCPMWNRYHPGVGPKMTN